MKKFLKEQYENEVNIEKYPDQIKLDVKNTLEL